MPAQDLAPDAALDLAAVRARFPALSRRMDGRTVVFADGPGGSQVPEGVIEAMSRYLRESNANTHGAFATSRETDAVIADAHAAAADVIGASADEVVFGPNATSLQFQVSRAIGATLVAGDEVVVTRLDHDANVRPWVRMAEDAGATVRWVDVRDEDATLDVDSFDAALGPRTRIVAFTLASNAVGSLTPAADLARRAHEAGALVAMDAVHCTPHRPVDVAELGADLLVYSPYKIFGPHLGVLYARRDLLRTWRPYKVKPATEELPGRWETGTQNHEGFAGWIAAVDHLAWLGGDSGTRRERVLAGMARIRDHEAALSRRFLERVAAADGIDLWGIADPARVDARTPTFAVRVRGEHPSRTAERLAAQGIFVWDGNYYALELMERLGLDEGGGAVRVGFLHYSTPDEVDRVVDALEGR